MLSIFILIPLLTVILLCLFEDYKKVRVVAAVGMGIQLIASIWMIFKFNAVRNAGNDALVLFEINYTWYEKLGISYHVGVDGISVVMLLLTAIVIFTGILASWNIKDRPREFFFSLILLSTGAFGFFISLDLFLMFFFFEIAVIPMYLLIGYWGSGKKEFAAMKLTLMLMGGSALLLVGILGLYFNSAPETGMYTFDMLKIAKVHIPLDVQLFLYPLTFIGFGVIGALFPLHTWSPDGHSAAPTAGSMLHAGVLMKLGGYGCLKVATFLMPEAAAEMSNTFITLAIIGVVYGAFATIRQTDLKYINAYSSVSHCALVLLGITMLTRGAMTGAVLQMFSHGVMTALFFALIGMIYGRTKTRDIREMGGLLKVMPFLCTCYIIAGFCSLGLPGLSGFVAELTLFVGAFQHEDMFHRVVTVLAAMSIVVTAVYILRVVGSFLLGPVKDQEYFKFKDATWDEKLSTGILVVTIIAVGSFPFWIVGLVDESMPAIVENLSRTMISLK